MKNQITVEIRVKEDGVGWGAITAKKMNFNSEPSVRTFCKNLAKFLGKEIRMNYNDSYQGHYFQSI